MQWLVTSPEDMAVLEEINRGGSDRALGIIAASLVEIHLTRLISKHSFQRALKRPYKIACSNRADLSDRSLRKSVWPI